MFSVLATYQMRSAHVYRCWRDAPGLVETLVLVQTEIRAKRARFSGPRLVVAKDANFSIDPDTCAIMK